MIAVQMIFVSYVSAIKTAGLIFTIILGKIFFQETDFKKRLFVGVVVVIGILLINHVS